MGRCWCKRLGVKVELGKGVSVAGAVVGVLVAGGVRGTGVGVGV